MMEVRPRAVYVLSLERAADRWRSCQERLARIGIEPRSVKRVLGFDARLIADERGSTSSGRSPTAEALVAEGYVEAADLDGLDPDLCVAAGHARALRQIEQDGHDWAMVVEDDFELTELGARAQFTRFPEVPRDAEWLWLHDSMDSDPRALGRYRPATGGFGMFAYLVSSSGARKGQQILFPFVVPCDLQIPAYSHGFAEPALRAQYTERRVARGQRRREQDDALRLSAYTHVPPLFRHGPEPSLRRGAWDAMFCPEPLDPALELSVVARWSGAQLWHTSGRRVGTSWSCEPRDHVPGHVAFGPYVEGLPAETLRARFHLEVAGSESEVARVDVYDARRQAILAARGISESGSWDLRFRPQPQSLLEFRVWWHGARPLTLHGVDVFRA
jgi:hypothetical protein